MLTLQYPPGQSSGAIELPNPDMGDSRSINNGQQINRTRAGEINAIYDSDWPQVTIRIYKWSVIKLADVDAFKTFLLATVGLKIGIVTHLSEVISGYIVTPVAEIITMKDNCTYEISFEFMEDAA